MEAHESQPGSTLPEQYFRLFADYSHDWETWVTPDGKYLYSSPSAEQVTGYAGEDFVADSALLSRLVHPEDQAAFREHQAMTRQPEQAEIEFRIIHRDGTVRWIGHRCQGVLSESGELLGRRASNRDITPQKSLALEAEAQAAECEAIFGSIAEGVVVYNTDGTVRRTNEAAMVAQHLRQHPADKPFSERVQGMVILDEEGQPVPLDRLPSARALRGEVARLVVTHVLQPDGSWLWFETSSAPLRNQAGAMAGAVSSFRDITDRREQEERIATLAAEEEQRAAELDTVISSIADGVSISDAQGRLVRYNEAAGRMLRYEGYETASYEERERRCTYRRADGTEFASEDLPLSRSLRGETVTGELIEMVWPEGGSTWVTSSSAPLYDAQGNLTGVVLTNTDMTAMHGVQQELEEAYARLHTLFDTEIGGIGIGITNVQGDIISSNDYYLNLLGSSREELERGEARWIEATPPEWLSADEKATVQLRERGVCDPYEKEYVRPDGSRAPVLLVNAMIPGENNEVLTFVVDMTERKRTQDELKRHRDHLEELVTQRSAELSKSERKYRELVEGANSAILHWDLDGTIVFVNQYAERLFGYEPGELVGRNVKVLRPLTETSGRSLEGLSDAILADPAGFEKNENENITKDGRRLWMAWSNRRLVGEQGNLEGNMAIGSDRTAQHQAEQELEVNQRRLRAAAAELSTAEQRERQRLATLIHDEVTQTLGGLKMQLQHLRMQPEAAPVVGELGEAIRVAGEAVLQSRSVISELNPPVLSQFGLIETLRWWGSQLHEKHGLEVSVNPECDLAQIENATQVTLFQTIKELLQNTVKHAQATRATITVRGTDGGFEIEVVDDGVGFDPNSDEYKGQGGFGLFNTRERMAYLGGELRIDSAPGRGTRVTVSLPLPCTEST